MMIKSIIKNKFKSDNENYQKTKHHIQNEKYENDYCSTEYNTTVFKAS